MDNIFRNKKIGLFVTILMFVFSVLCIVGLSFALRNVTIESDTINSISVGTVNGKIREEYTEPHDLAPGADVKKVVNIENTGSMPALVRAKFVKQCGYSRDSSGNIVVDSRIDTSKILINVDETSWIDGEDGYYYYNQILEAGATTSNPLFKKYTISSTAGNEYRNAKCDIIVSTNIIEATSNSPSEWHKTYRFLNIDPPSENTRLPETEVIYNSPDKKFNIDANKIDLFNNFKNLTPGVSRTQVIKVTNAYPAKQEIYLRAETTNQDAQNIDKINTLLKEYATIKIENGNSIIYNGPVWGNLDKESNTMKNNISLGEFTATQTKNLIVTLSVSPDMGDEYQGLTGNVKWVFGTYDTEARVTVHHYLENSTTPLAPDVPLIGNVGENYTTSSMVFDDYELVAVPQNAEGTFTDDPIDVIYYYHLKNPVFETIPSVTKTATDTLSNINDFINYTVTYTANLAKYKGDVQVKIVDTLPAPIDESSLTFEEGSRGTYDRATNTITWIVNENNINTFTNGNKQFNIIRKFKVKYLNYENVDNFVNNVKSTTSFTGGYDPIENTDSATTGVDLKGRLIVQYIVEGTNYKLKDDTITEDNIGKTYHATPENFEGYELSDQTDNTSGKYKLEDTVVKFYYKILDPAFENAPNITKTGTTHLEYSSDFVDYTINYTAKLSTYVGGVTVKIVDTLPAKIDANSSNLDGGTYDSENNTITWTEQFTDINTFRDKDNPAARSIAVSKSLRLKYLNLSDQSELVNKVKSTTSFSTDHSPIENTATHTTDLNLKGKVITKYLHYGTDIELLPEDVSIDTIGKEYTTSEKPIDGYVLVETPSNATGVYGINDTIVKYYYRKTTELKDGITKVGPAKQVNSIKIFSYNIKYKGTIKDYLGDAKLTVIDYVPYELDLSESDLNSGVYDRQKGTITWVFDYDSIDTKVKPYDIEKSIDVTLAFKDNIKDPKVTNKVTYRLDTDKSSTGEDTVITELYKMKSKVIVNHYLYGTKKKLAKSKTISGYTGDKYSTSANKLLLLNGYKLKLVDGDANGTILDITKQVNYYYVLDKKAPKNPFTGDNITIYIIALIVTIIISGITICYIISSKKKSKS